MAYTRKYTKQFIEEAINLFLVGDRTIGSIAKSLGIPHSTLRQWVNKFNLSGKKSLSVYKDVTPEEAELSRLKSEMANLKMENAILKKAVGIFSQEQK